MAGGRLWTLDEEMAVRAIPAARRSAPSPGWPASLAGATTRSASSDRSSSTGTRRAGTGPPPKMRASGSFAPRGSSGARSRRPWGARTKRCGPETTCSGGADVTPGGAVPESALGIVSIWRRDGADWRLVKRRAKPVPLGVVPALRGRSTVAVWVPERVHQPAPVVSAADGDLLADFLATGPRGWRLGCSRRTDRGPASRYFRRRGSACGDWRKVRRVLASTFRVETLAIGCVSRTTFSTACSAAFAAGSRSSSGRPSITTQTDTGGSGKLASGASLYWSGRWVTDIAKGVPM